MRRFFGQGKLEIACKSPNETLFRTGFIVKYMDFFSGPTPIAGSLH
jgi:hypothetical protein